MEYVLAGIGAWVGSSVLAALAWSRFHAGLDRPAPPRRSVVDWDAEYRRALEAERRDADAPARTSA